MNTQSLLLTGMALLVSTGHAGESAIEEVLVIAEPDTRIYELADTLDVSPDSASLLKRAVGANVVSNGPISGMAQYRGMSRMRISSRINGQVISPGGPNWMDPPLSYAPAAHLESLEVHRGIAPVSAGMETIGGVVNANTWQGEFAESGSLVQGRIRGGLHSVNGASLLAGAMVVANARHRLKASAITEQADDSDFAGGTITPTEYRRDRVDLGYGFTSGRHELVFDYGRNETGDAGTPALPMDVGYIDSDLLGAGYTYRGENWQLEGRVWHSLIDHGMSNFHLRPPPMADSLFRRNTAHANNTGFSVVLGTAAWRFGIDGHRELHNSDIDNPNAPMFFVTNFNDAERSLLGVFAERAFRMGEAWTLELGGRYNRIESDADEVDATPAVIGMPPAVALRDAFNDADRNITDHNLDLVARLHFDSGRGPAYYIGAARKTRAPSYQERFLWLPLQATAGLADGRTYTGDPTLKSERASELEAGLDLETDRLQISPRLFYRDVRDYIQGTESTNSAAIMFVRMMNAMNGTSAQDPLGFSNLDAKFYGFDLEWSSRLGERWQLGGVINYVRGTREGDDLYRVAPLNGFVALSYGTSRWNVTAESFFSAAQEHVSEVNGEPESSGYATANLKGYWKLSQLVRLSAGVDNLFDRVYRDHLGGINRVSGNPDIEVGERLPGNGRNFFARFDLTF